VILVDTSVVIDFLRTSDAKLGNLFQTQNAAICGITRAEVLWGTRSPKHRTALLAALNSFRQIPILEQFWDEAGDHLASLRRNGITVPFQDVIIATVAIANDTELWTRDKQFQMIQTVLPQLRLFSEPP
jgi:predicted nucleic acid-binding protein